MADTTGMMMARVAGTNESWHGLENVAPTDATIAEWKRLSGLDYTVSKLPVFAMRKEDGKPPRMIKQKNRFHLVRDDNDAFLGHCTDHYKMVQPDTIARFFESIFMVSDEWRIDTMGSLKGGKVVWSLAEYNREFDVIGSKHRVYGLAATSFDGTLATRIGGTATRVVCENTLQAAAYGESVIAIRHNVEFDAVQHEKALEMLQKCLADFDGYRDMAESLYQIKMSERDVDAFFRKLAGVKESDDIESKGFGKAKAIIDKLKAAFDVTLNEPGTDEMTAWAALGAVTRFVDHDRSARQTIEGETKNDARFASAQFGSGSVLKAQAVKMLMTA